MGSRYTEAQKAASLKYLKEKTDDIRIRTPKGKKDKIAAYAKEHGESLNAFINRAIDEAMERQV
jgi:predicted HicB family RNase H-like nuclease|nr:MAG TPA: Alginate and motility regulator [Bacteriophage sp.]